jgi:tetratricopeptide (TPR) repeat protein
MDDTADSIQVGDISQARGVAIGAGARVEIYEVPPAAKLGSAPPLPGLVVGREGVLRDLKTRLGIGSKGQGQASRPAAAGQDGLPLQVLTAIRGWPGIGKTTVAAVLAHDPDVMAAFPDGVLWTSLGPTPNLFSELTTWSRALGAEDLRARTLKEASAHLAALLLNKRMLLVVDDVWKTEHARPFMVGGHRCGLLVTTRSPRVASALAPTAADVYRLPVLSEEKAMELLQKLAPEVVASHPDECRALVREMEGLPLALQVAGRMLAVEADCGFGVDELLAELREGTALLGAPAPVDRVDLANLADLADESTPTVAVLLQHSTARLDEAARAGFACLAVFAAKPATFDLAALQAVWQVKDAKPIARALVDRGLLEYVPELGRYQMHALLVMHARALLEQDGAAPGPDEAHRRHAQYYLDVLRAADALYLRGGASVERGVALFDQEWDNIQAGQAWVAAHARQDSETACLCSAYPDAGAYCLELRRHPRERIAWLEAALVAAQCLKDQRGEGAHVGGLGLAYADMGKAKRAIKQYQQALAIAREIGDRRNEGIWLGSLGNAYADLGQAERAIEQLRQALAIARAICAASTPDSPEWKAARRGEGTVLGNLGIAYRDQGQVERAIRQYEQALEIDREIGDRRNEGALLGRLGLACVDLGQAERAIEHFRDALAIAREIGDRRNEGAWLGSLGLAYAALGQAKRAIKHYRQALAIARDVGDQRNEGAWLNNLGVAYRDQGQVERAIKHCKQALAIQREIGDRRGEGNSLGSLGAAYRDLGQVEQAIEHYEQALAIAREIGDRVKEGTWLNNLGLAYAGLGQVDRARECLARTLAIFEEIKSPYAERVGRILAGLG